MDRNGEVDSEWEAQGSASTQGLCQAVQTLGLLLAPVGLMVSEGLPGATRCLSFRSSDLSYRDQASRGYTVQEPALNSTGAQWCHVRSASVALCGSYGFLEEQPEKHRTDFSAAEKVLHQADTCLKESN